MFPLTKYAAVKDNYCVCYYGSNTKHIQDLLLVRPIFESKYPGLKLHLCCRDDVLYVSEGQPRIIPQSKMKNSKDSFGYIREMRGDTSPALVLATECELEEALGALEKVPTKKRS